MTLQEYRQLRSQKVVSLPAQRVMAEPDLPVFLVWGPRIGWPSLDASRRAYAAAQHVVEHLTGRSLTLNASASVASAAMPAYAPRERVDVYPEELSSGGYVLRAKPADKPRDPIPWTSWVEVCRIAKACGMRPCGAFTVLP